MRSEAIVGGVRSRAAALCSSCARVRGVQLVDKRSGRGGQPALMPRGGTATRSITCCTRTRVTCCAAAERGGSGTERRVRHSRLGGDPASAASNSCYCCSVMFRYRAQRHQRSEESCISRPSLPQHDVLEVVLLQQPPHLAHQPDEHGAVFSCAVPRSRDEGGGWGRGRAVCTRRGAPRKRLVSAPPCPPARPQTGKRVHARPLAHLCAAGGGTRR